MARAMHLSTTGFNALVGFGNCPGGTWKGHDLEIIPVWCREKMRQHGLNGQTWTTIYTYICIHIKFEVWILNRISQIFFWLINSFRLIPLIWDWQSWHADRELLILLWISIRKSHDLKFLSQHCSNQRFYPMDNTVFLHCISKTWFVFLEFLSRIHFLFFLSIQKREWCVFDGKHGAFQHERQVPSCRQSLQAQKEPLPPVDPKVGREKRMDVTL